MLTYYIYTDGACSGNPGPGGWAFAAYVNESNLPYRQDSGGEEKTTNNRMEILAIIKAFDYILNNYKDDEYIICTDSAYVYNCFHLEWYINWMKNGWKNSKKEPIANRDLWEILISKYFSAIKQNYNFQLIKVQGHATDDKNNYVDKLAVQAAKEYK